MSDRRIEQVIGTLLQVGVLLSAAVVLAGGVIVSLRHATPESLIQFGLLLLIATPVARVVLSLVAFALQRDRVYVTVTLIVLGVLAYGLVLPH